MRPETPRLLEDIRDAAQYIADRTAGETLDGFRQDRDLRQVVERNFEIIGEAVRRLSRLDPETAHRLTDYSQMIAFRNLLIHAYDVIDPVRVWRTIEASVPLLLAEVAQALQEAGDLDSGTAGRCTTDATST
jgi:uncharacterized protein with HEPN domain